jgi:hypothetical protein
MADFSTLWNEFNVFVHQRAVFYCEKNVRERKMQSRAFQLLQHVHRYLNGFPMMQKKSF